MLNVLRFLVLVTWINFFQGVLACHDGPPPPWIPPRPSSLKLKSPQLREYLLEQSCQVSACMKVLASAPEDVIRCLGMATGLESLNSCFKAICYQLYPNLFSIGCLDI